MGSSHPTAKFKMFRPLLCVPLAIALVLLQQVPTASGTFAIAGTIGGTAITLTAAQTTALAAVALLGVKLKLVGAYLLSRRGKRSAEEEEVPTIETFATLEVEDCYKRVICAASTGKVENPQVQRVPQERGQVRAQVHLQPRHGHPQGLVLNGGAEIGSKLFRVWDLRTCSHVSGLLWFAY